MSKELEAARALVKMLEEREQSNKVELASLMLERHFLSEKGNALFLNNAKE